MRILFRDRHEILELLERLNEKELTGPEAILLRMCRVCDRAGPICHMQVKLSAGLTRHAMREHLEGKGP